MMKQFRSFVVLICLVSQGILTTARSPTMLGIEEDATEFYEERKLEEQEHEEENEIDPRLIKKYPEYSIGPYECSTHVQCANGGVCVEAGIAGSVCNCTNNYLGPYCDYSSNSIDRALRVHPLFKVSFAECMTKAGKTAGINALSLLEKCGGGQNMCWLHEGGVKGLKCFFWCLTNGMRLSLTEAKPSEESRLQLYAEVFQKLARERNLPTKRPKPRPKGVPIASLQINLYDTSKSEYPFPKHNTFGLPGISIKPSVSFWNPSYSPDPYDPEPKEPFGSPYSPGEGGNPYETNPSEEDDFQYPKSHEIPTPSTNDDEMGPVDENGFSPYFWDVETSISPYDSPPEIPEKESEKEESQLEEDQPGDNFLNDALHDVMMNIYGDNVVEADDSEEEEDIMTLPFPPYEPFPLHDEMSNMRGSPPVEEEG